MEGFRRRGREGGREGGRELMPEEKALLYITHLTYDQSRKLSPKIVTNFRTHTHSTQYTVHTEQRKYYIGYHEDIVE